MVSPSELPTRSTGDRPLSQRGRTRTQVERSPALCQRLLEVALLQELQGDSIVLLGQILGLRGARRPKRGAADREKQQHSSRTMTHCFLGRSSAPKPRRSFSYLPISGEASAREMYRGVGHEECPSLGLSPIKKDGRRLAPMAPVLKFASPMNYTCPGGPCQFSTRIFLSRSALLFFFLLLFFLSVSRNCRPQTSGNSDYCLTSESRSVY